MLKIYLPTLNKNHLQWFSLSLLVIVLDQITKIAADKYLGFHQPIPIIPHFNLTLAYNTGAAFSFLSEAGGWQRWFFTVLTIVISTVLVVWLLRLPREERWTAAALSLVLGGAIGNLIDRVVYGHVIDFLDVYYKQYHWPTFNIADSAISVGAAILIISSLFMPAETSAKP
jgi:signal peptidase II